MLLNNRNSGEFINHSGKKDPEREIPCFQREIPVFLLTHKAHGKPGMEVHYDFYVSCLYWQKESQKSTTIPGITGRNQGWRFPACPAGGRSPIAEREITHLQREISVNSLALPDMPDKPSDSP